MSAHQAVEPRVCWVHVGPHELESQYACERKHTGHGYLCCGVRRNENEHSCQEHPPAALDHLVVVQVGACVRINGSQRLQCFAMLLDTIYYLGGKVNLM